MKDILKINVFFLLAVGTGRTFEIDYEEDPQENTRQFVLDQHRQTLQSLKAEMTKQSLELEKYNKLLNEKQTAMELNMKRTLGNLSVLFARKLELSETNVLSALTAQAEHIVGDFRQVSKSLAKSFPWANQSDKAKITTEIITVAQTLVVQQTALEVVQVRTEKENLSGQIEFEGETNPHLRLKIWVFAAGGEGCYNPIRFVMERMNLGRHSDISLWSDSGHQSVWNGSQSNWREERNFSARLILLTLRIRPHTTHAYLPTFKLTFNATWGASRYEHLSEVIRNEGLLSVSFPPGNVQNYLPNTILQSVVAPQSGRPFKLTLKYLDVPCPSNFSIAFLEESRNGLNYKRIDSPSVRVCGRAGNVSELLGVSTVAILWFESSNSASGNGFRVEAGPV